MKNLKCHIENRTRDLPSRCAVPQPTALPCSPPCLSTCNILPAEIRIRVSATNCADAKQLLPTFARSAVNRNTPFCYVLLRAPQQNSCRYQWQTYAKRLETFILHEVFQNCQIGSYVNSNRGCGLESSDSAQSRVVACFRVR